MSINPVVAPFPIFQDRDGQPLEAGFVYVGVANLDPVTNPIVVYWDRALTITAPQPIRTINGYASRNGSPGALFAASDFSITVKDKQNVLVVTSPSISQSGLGDIVLAAGESLTAQANSSIAIQDGATVAIGTATGTGVLVTLASNARFVGDIVPNATGTQSLGSAARKWDVNGDTVAGTSVVTYTDTPTVASPTELLRLNQQKSIVACGRIGNTGNVSTNHFNIASATNALGVSVVTLDSPVEDDAVVLCMANGTGGGFDVVGQVAAGGATVTVTQRDGGALLSQIYNLLVIGRPRGGVTQP